MISLKSILLSIFLLILYWTCSANPFQSDSSFTSFDIPEQTHQVIVVTTASWESKQGKLKRYERVNGQWKSVGVDVPVAVGKSGLGWGSGLHKNANGSGKKEGDGKAPAGVFTLGMMFGYNEKSLSHLNYPYQQSTNRDYFIDDVNSDDYNKWVTIPVNKLNNPKERWGSYEIMRRADHLYEYGIIVSHNMDPIVKEKGSAIFIHVWRSTGSPTLGCTSMSKENIVTLMRWIDPIKSPLLIQVPESELKKLR